jgi:hypothetical protein
MLAIESSEKRSKRRVLEENMASSWPRVWPVLNGFNIGEILLLCLWGVKRRFGNQTVSSAWTRLEVGNCSVEIMVDPSQFGNPGDFRDKLTIETPEQTVLEFEVAGVGSRFLALAYDTLLQILVGIGLLIIFF